MSALPSWSLQAAAKVNLFLHVVSKRKDGYHQLQSLMASVSLYDTLKLTLNESKKGSLTMDITGDDSLAWQLTSDENNLVLRAARLFSKHNTDIASSYGIHFSLHKKIPQGAGLGGGSSDAAAALRLLSHACKRPLPPHTETLTLGADVPFCLQSNEAWIEGIGDKMTAANTPLAPHGMVLVYPHQKCATAAIFKHNQQRSTPQKLPPQQHKDLLTFLQKQRNDLQDSAIAHHSEIADCLTLLKSQEGALFARMSGSGSCCFALFASEEEAKTRCHKMRATHPHWWISHARILTQLPPVTYHP